MSQPEWSSPDFDAGPPDRPSGVGGPADRRPAGREPGPASADLELIGSEPAPAGPGPAAWELGGPPLLRLPGDLPSGMAPADGERRFRLDPERPWSVFVSHTAEMREFPRRRSFIDAVKDAVTTVGDHIVEMAYFGAQDTPPARYCIEAVRKSDVYVGVIGFNYGSPVRELPEVSYTELEFEAATRAGKPRLIFLLDEEAEVPIGRFADPLYGRRQMEFRRRLLVGENLMVAAFREAGELQAQVQAALTRLREEVRRGRPSPPPEPDPPASRKGERRRPWMVPEARGMVARPELSAAVLRLLVAPRAAPATRPVVLTGAGGFGKSMLAIQVCRDPAIKKRFTGGLLWVTLGEAVGGPQLTDRINDLCEMLSGTRPNFSEPQQAGFRLGELLGSEPTLLVIDDVWRSSQLRPFLLGGPGCVRLVTSRMRGLIGDADIVQVAAMADTEAVRLLLRDLPRDVPEPVLRRLLVVTGRWPVLLALVNRAMRRRARDGMPVGRAAERVLHRLEQRGPTALDVSRAEERAQAVNATMSASLDLLTGDNLDRYQELAVFAEDVAVPPEVLRAYWAATGDLDADEADDLCEELADLSLIEYTHDPPGLVLQDVLRTYLRVLAGPQRLRELDGVLCDALRTLVPDTAQPGDAGRPAGGRTPWWTAPKEVDYLWSQLVRHLAGAGRHAELAELLTDLRWTVAKLADPQHGPAALEADLAVAVEALPDNPVLPALRRALWQNAHLLAPTSPPEALAATLLSRLDGIRPLAGPCEQLARRAPVPRLANRWSLPDQPHPALLRRLPGHHRWVNGLAAGPDSSWLVSAGRDGTVRIWGVEEGTSRAVLTGHDGVVLDCAIAPDGNWLVSAGADGTLRIWSTAAETADPVDDAVAETEASPAAGPPAGLVLTGHRGAVNACAVTVDGERVVSVGEDGQLRLWDAHSGAAELVVRVSAGQLLCCAVGPDGDWVAVAGDDGMIRILGIGDGRLLHRMAGHRGSVLALAVAPGGDWLASAGEDGTIRCWDTRTGRQTRVLSTGGRPVRDCAVASDGRWLVTVGADVVRLWDLPEGTQRAELTGAIGSRSCVVAPDGSWIASAGRYGDIQLWATGTDLPGHTVTGRNEGMRGCAVLLPKGAAQGDPAGAGGLVVSCGEDGTATAWDLPTGELVTALPGLPGPARGCVAAPDGSWVAVPAQPKALRLWQPATGAVCGMITADVPILAFDVPADGRWLVGACADGALRLWDTETCEWMATIPDQPNSAQACAAAPDGSWVASGGNDGMVRIFDAASLTRRAVLSGHVGPVLGLAASPDGRRLASTGNDNTVRVWDVAAARGLAVLRGHTHTVRGAAFAPDGRWLATAGGDGSVRIWEPDTWRCVTMIRFVGAARACAWLPDSSGLAVAGSAGLYLFSLVTGS